MSNLDQSLDAILAAKPRQAKKSRPAKAATAGNGVKKPSVKSTTKPGAGAKAAVAKTLAKVPESSKIIVHGLPADVTEKQIKEYMTAEIGPVARCELAYNAQGKSKGSATIVFRKDSNQNYAQKACALLNGRSVDSTGPKPLKMRVEIITEVPQPGLADRLGGLPKSVAQAVAKGQKKSGAVVPNSKADVKSKKLKKTGPGRVKKVAKTAEELDAEMSDYFATK
ncbi:protein of unknown function [Taphrina deformans PYCC 5710]|uniref:RRM domain-containing protein n=1 Tax=Taphrina deformans (strain PYCC 5710 / ATCC 11124 / CBS 356.35 / IMI 108563 / JCM 9778 / NBRC 8474) TaxID=1097556 RepID=R4XG39_TAPDE|nr:protein of unknown function [Taphrina deformans PYCC 5710]|eukprot:CCG84847.1 protein of unknown function [Taphrina deformans PYCC 5710]